MGELEEAYVVPHEEPREQRTVAFEGDELIAALSTSGAIYVSMPDLCRALGIESRGQTQRILRNADLREGLREFNIKTRAGTRDAYCLELGMIAVWLIDADTSRMKNRPAAEKIRQYKLRLVPVATRVFLETMQEFQDGSREVLHVPEVASLTMTPNEAQIVISLLQDHIRIIEHHGDKGRQICPSLATLSMSKHHLYDELGKSHPFIY